MRINVPLPTPGAWLKPGLHTIDGVSVMVDGAPGTDGTILYPLTLGRHFIDGQVAIVHNPANVIKVPVGRR
jgi:hypothetical protein